VWHVTYVYVCECDMSLNPVTWSMRKHHIKPSTTLLPKLKLVGSKGLVLLACILYKCESTYTGITSRNKSMAHLKFSEIQVRRTSSYKDIRLFHHEALKVSFFFLNDFKKWLSFSLMTLHHVWCVGLRGGGLGSRPIFKKFNETYAPS